MSNDYDDTLSALPSDVTTLAPSQAYLVVVRGTNVGETFPVVGPTVVIGRGTGADVRLNDEGISRFHCKIRQQQGGFLLEDLGSRNGTYCNGEPVLPTMRMLHEGDRLQIGTTFVLRFTYVETTTRPSAPLMVQDAVHDPLTGVFSKHYFMDQLEKDVTASLESKRMLSLVLVHVDRFSNLAPDALDETVKAVSVLIRECIQPDDLLARIGLGDFALILRHSSPGNTFMLAERMRKTAKSPITLSLGIAAISELSIESSHDLLAAAGSALQRVRSQGGNRTVLCTPELIREPRSRPTV